MDPGQLPSYSAAGLDTTCLHKHKIGSSTERVNVECLEIWLVGLVSADNVTGWGAIAVWLQR